MIIPGLASVTFRDRGLDECVTLAAECGLRAIEWAGDVHVPAGDMAAAEHARARCGEDGLTIGTYGSYHKAGHDDPAEFPTLVRTAVALGAPRIRVWAGTQASADLSAPERLRTTEALRTCAKQAEEHGVALTVEHHVQSLTDTIASAQQLYADLAEVTLATHWQPRELPDADECLAEVRALLPGLASVHAFSWGADGFTERLTLAHRADLWRPVLSALAADGADRQVMLEFVRDDSPAALAEDAAELLRWLKELD